MLRIINRLVDEKAMILMNERQTRDAEIGWLSTLLAGVEKHNTAAVIAEVEGRRSVAAR